MTQSGALKVLKKKDRWMTTKEVSEALDISSSQENLRKLFEQGEILRDRKLINKHYTYIWRARN